MEDGERHCGVPREKQVELVAICRYKTYAKTWNEQTKRYSLPMKTSESISVLWVEWVKGVVYRLASGEVERQAWNKLPLEHISSIMG